jgi:hypothetical protein
LLLADRLWEEAGEEEPKQMIPELALAYLVASQPAPPGTPSSGINDWEYVIPSSSRSIETMLVSIHKGDPTARHLKFDLPPNILIDTEAEGLVPLCTEQKGPTVSNRLYSLTLNQARYLVVISAQSIAPKGSRLDVSIFNEASATKYADADAWKCWRAKFAAARPKSRA